MLRAPVKDAGFLKMNHPHVAIVGATGAVGVEMLLCLEQRNFPLSKLKLLASARSAGKKMTFRGEEITVEELTHDSFGDVDIALFSAGGGISLEYGPSAAAAGAVVIDNSSAFRMDADVPLVVPEINPEAAKNRPRGIIANPNCTTIISLMALAPLHKAFGLRSIIASTYQAVSGGGLEGIDVLARQVAHVGDKAAALAQGDTLRLNGSKKFVTPATGADGWVVLARLAEQPVLVWVPAQTEGVTHSDQRAVDGAVLCTLSMAPMPWPQPQMSFQAFLAPPPSTLPKFILLASLTGRLSGSRPALRIEGFR